MIGLPSIILCYTNLMYDNKKIVIINTYYLRRKNDIFSLKNQLDIWHNCFCLCHLKL
jgi:hypothetical protein